MKSSPPISTSTAAARAALLERVSVIDERCVLYRELPVFNLDSLSLMLDRADALAQGLSQPVLILDLRETKLPSAAQRAMIRKQIGKLRSFSRYVVVTGKNSLLNVAVRYLLGRAAAGRMTVYTTLKEAREAARETGK